MLVTDTMCLGGKERVVLLLARGLRSLGHDVVIVSIRHLGEFGEIFSKEGGQVFAANSSHGFDYYAIRRLGKFIKKFKPDVINIHDRSSLFYVQLAAIGRKVKTVFTAHGLLMNTSRDIRFDQQWAADKLDASTAVAQAVADDYTRLLQLRRPVKVISNGIEPVTTSPELRKATREEFGLGENDYVCLSIGNIKPAKGYEDLIDAAAATTSILPEANVRFLIVGGAADRHYLATLKDKVEDLKLEKIVDFAGPVSDVERLYSAADCFVISSRTEGLPMVLLEAMSAGVPAVATDVGGIGKVLNEQCGLLCPAKKPNSLAAAIHKLYNQPDMAKQLALNAKDRLDEKFSLAQMTAEYLDLFDEICDTKKQPVIMGSPLPPLEGGMASVADEMIAQLADEFKVLGINTGKLTEAKRSTVKGIKSQFQLRTRVKRDCKDNPGSIFHLHTCSGMTFWRDGWLVKPAKRKGTKVAMHIHGARFIEFLAQLGPVKRMLAQRILERCDAVIMLGDSLRQKIRQLDIAPGANYVVVHNGVEIGSQLADEAGATFLFLGNYGQRKGAADLIDAAAYASKKGVELRITLAGVETQPGQIEKLQAKINSLNLQEKVTIVGLLKGQEKQKALLHAAALVLPSYREAQPMAILEAMAVGLPVVSTNVGDIPSVVRDGCEGLLVNPGDIEALAKAMIRLETNEALRMALAGNARLRVEKFYSIEESKRQLMEVYESLLEGE